MKSPLAPHASTLFVLVRIVAGLLFSLHGIQKVFGVLGFSEPVALTSQLGLAGIIETIGGLSIALGFYTSVWAFVASGEMAMAYFQAHLPRGTWPIQNGGELALLYCFLFLYIASRGTVKWGVRS
ncbi:MAG TPA: DoxX family protein [Vicinamibacterales bacterium]|nr:DoxX family protein [Vicinamibacterales bacterium]